MKVEEGGRGLRNLFEGSRYVYALTFSSDETTYCNRAESDAEEFEVTMKYDFFDLFYENETPDIVFRFLLEGGKDGNIITFISLPHEMSLRMRAGLSFYFPGSSVLAIERVRKDCERSVYLPPFIVAKSLGNLLEAHISYNEEKSKQERGEGDGYFDEGDIYEEGSEDDAVDEGATQGKIAQKAEAYNIYECVEVSENEGSVNYLAMLDELIGLDEVKKQIRQIASYSIMMHELRELNTDMKPIVLNMVFSGNPGTAKTTVARILAGIFCNLGLISHSEIVEVGRSQLIAEYTGQTAVKVRNVFESAEGKLLFIDEAYSLVDGYKGSFGDEAIHAIVQEMENRREKTIVIFAGYPDKMAEFFDRNHGLKSRVPFHISFPDYSAEEMLEIVKLDAAKRGFRLISGAEEKILSLCKAAKNHRETGNGRFCRNLVDKAVMSYAERVYANADAEGAVHNFSLTESDFSSMDDVREEKAKKRMIGFRI